MLTPAIVIALTPTERAAAVAWWQKVSDAAAATLPSCVLYTAIVDHYVGGWPQFAKDLHAHGPALRLAVRCEAEHDDFLGTPPNTSRLASRLPPRRGKRTNRTTQEAPA